MDSLEGNNGCTSSEIACSSGSIAIVACTNSEALLKNKRFKKNKFRSLALGSLVASFEEDWSKGYFAYMDPIAGAIYFEGDLDAFDDPFCASKAMPIVRQYLMWAGFREEARRLLQEIIFRRVFLLAGSRP